MVTKKKKTKEEKELEEELQETKRRLQGMRHLKNNWKEGFQITMWIGGAILILSLVFGISNFLAVKDLGNIICEEQYGEEYEYKGYNAKEQLVTCLEPLQKETFDGGYTTTKQRGNNK